MVLSTSYDPLGTTHEFMMTGTAAGCPLELPDVETFVSAMSGLHTSCVVLNSSTNRKQNSSMWPLVTSELE